MCGSSDSNLAKNWGVGRKADNPIRLFNVLSLALTMKINSFQGVSCVLQVIFLVVKFLSKFLLHTADFANVHNIENGSVN